MHDAPIVDGGTVALELSAILSPNGEPLARLGLPEGSFHERILNRAQLLALLEFQTELAGVQTIERLAEIALRCLSKGTLQMDYAGLYFLAEDGQEVWCPLAHTPALPMARSQLHTTMVERRQIVQQYSAGDADAVFGTTRLTLPVVVDGKPFGALLVGTDNPRGLLPSVASFGEIVSSKLAMALKSRALASEVTRSEERYRRIFDESQNPMVVMDLLTMRFLDVNPAATAFFGYSRAQMLEMTPANIIPPGRQPFAADELAAMLQNSEINRETITQKADGTISEVVLSFVSADWKDGSNVLIVTLQDQTAIRQTAAKHLADKTALEEAQRLGNNGSWWHDLRSGERFWSAQLFRIFGLPDDAAVPAGEIPFATFISASDVTVFKENVDRALQGVPAIGTDYYILKADGSAGWIHCDVMAEFGADGQPTMLSGTVLDIGDQKAREEELERLATIDALTGLPNRRGLAMQLRTAIDNARRDGCMTALFFVDIDDFKVINDTLGHAAGDDLLVGISRRLQQNFRSGDVIARMGGDEFVVLLPRIADADRAASAARNLEQAFAEPFKIGDQEFAISGSVGVAVFPQDGDDVETLLMNADTAMYSAKREGRGSYRLFSRDMRAAAAQRLQVELDIRRAVAAEEFDLEYQPIYHRSGQLAACEALLRWPKSYRWPIAPSTFIPIAESSGLIVPLGAWILRTACRQAARWNEQSTPLRVCVNVSAKQIVLPQFVTTVSQALEESGLSPELLELELTETALLSDPEACINVIVDIRALGVRISLDDFGTGYNCLANLRRLKVDTLKLDRCFVTDIATNPIDRAVASGVLAAAAVINATVVAEGVETNEQLQTLLELGCNEVQGYLLGRPCEPKMIERLLAGRPDLHNVANVALEAS